VDTVRVGIIGAGGIARHHHVPSLLKHPAARIVAICDVNRASASALAADLGIDGTYTDYLNMLERVPLDAVVVATSNDQHAPASLAAIRRGLHVLCEKPLALDASGARALVEAAAAAGVVTAVNFSYRPNPAVRYIKDIIVSGDLGQIYEVSFQYLQGYLADPDAPLLSGTVWRVQKKHAGLGVLGDLGSHLIDLARFWFGEIVAVQSMQRTFVHERPTADGGRIVSDGDDVTVALLDFAAGMVATFQTSWSAVPWGNHQRVEIYGSKGSIIYENENQRSIRAVFGSEMAKYRTLAEIPVPQQYHDRTRSHAEGFVDAVLKGQAYVPGFAEGARCQEILDAIAATSISGGRARV
jgi:predicted dehydrogenase